MPVKLPLLVVSTVLVTGMLMTGARDGMFETEPDGARTLVTAAPSGPAPPPTDKDHSEDDLEGLARDILSIRPPKADRLPTALPGLPFELSQADRSETPAPPPAPTGNAETTGKDAPVEVDETALRYFAARGDAARLAAEIARLRTLYPNWTPPADPLAVPQNADRQLEAMWQLYAEGRYAEVRKAVVERQASTPDWQPPADLLERLTLSEARGRLINASNQKQYQIVIEVGAANPALLNCSEVDVLWRLAEAFRGTERPQRAVDAYRYILTNCTDPAERIATMQKAASGLDYNRVQPLLALEKPTDGGGEFDSIRDDLARRFVGEASEDPALAIAPQYLERVRDLALGPDAKATDMLLLGWYDLRRDDMAEAESWFQRAREREDSAEAARGLALTLLQRKRPQEAEAVLHRWRDASEDTAAVYLSAVDGVLAVDPAVAIDEAVLLRMAQAALHQRHAPAAQLFGWYARGFAQPETAARWFETALDWAPDDEPSAYGLALTRLQLKDRAGFADLQKSWASRSVRIADLAKTAAATPRQGRAAESAQSRSPRSASDGAPWATSSAPATDDTRRMSCINRINPSRLSATAALARGWCLMELNRPLEAAETFAVALSSTDRKTSADASYGQSLAYLRLGLTDKAAVAATAAPMEAPRARQLQGSILADRAVQAFASDRFREALLYLDQRAEVQQETVDLMVLRGYSYMKLNRPREALRIFEAAAATGNRDASRGLADAQAAMGR